MDKKTRTTHHLYHPALSSRRLFPLLILFLLLILFHLLILFLLLITFLLPILLRYSINHQVCPLDLSYIFIPLCKIRFFLLFLKVYLPLLYPLISLETFHLIWNCRMALPLFAGVAGVLSTPVTRCPMFRTLLHPMSFPQSRPLNQSFTILHLITTQPQ